MTKILIIGAGMSGLSAARELQNNGHEVTVIDKGRGIGGRMATRRFAGGRFDHGAQFFTTRNDEFKAATKEWQSENVAQHWFDGTPTPDDPAKNDGHPRFCGTSGMTGIGKHLMEGLNVQLGFEIESLTRKDGTWRATTADGTTFSGEELILTAPIPQALKLFDTSDQLLPDAMRATLESVTYEPCFAVLTQLDGPSNIAAPGLLYINGEPIWWIADNSQKGVSPIEGSVTIHSSGNYARAHYDDDQTAVGEELIAHCKEWLGRPVKEFQVRRWRYSKPENPLDIGVARDDGCAVTFAGDALMGAKIEGAFTSGLMAARKLVVSDNGFQMSDFG